MRGNLTAETRLKAINTRLKNDNAKLRLKISELEQTVREQQEEIDGLLVRLSDKEAQRKELLQYLYKPKNQSSDRQKVGKKIGARGFQRPLPKPEEITETHTFRLTRCSACRRPVGDPVDTVVKYEEDIDLQPRKKVSEYIITRHWCSHCQEFVRSGDVPRIPRIGLNVLGYILYAKYRLRLPIDLIKESLLDLHNFAISEGEIAEKLQEAAELFGDDYKAIAELIRQAKAVYADETGWRMDGRNFWLWVFATGDGIKYVIEDTRGKGVIEENLGRKKDRVIISDGYQAYGSIPGDKQQCWVHLLRAARVRSESLYQELAEMYSKLLSELEKPIVQRSPPLFEKALNAIIKKKYKEREAAHVQARIKRHKHDLLTCLRYKNILPENNTAERALRPQVVMRKISGGSRSLKGALAHAINTSVIETKLKLEPEKHFFEIMLPLLKKRYSGM